MNLFRVLKTIPAIGRVVETNHPDRLAVHEFRNGGFVSHGPFYSVGAALDALSDLRTLRAVPVEPMDDLPAFLTRKIAA